MFKTRCACMLLHICLSGNRLISRNGLFKTHPFSTYIWKRKCKRHISYKHHVTNEELRAKIQQAIGPHEDLLTIVKRRKLQWCGHVSRSSGLANTILQGTVKGGRRQDRQRKRWEDNIREWTGRSHMAVENRKKWRKLVAKSSVVPQRPSRLRD